MGSKYTTQSASGYNSSPPADDGSQVAANLVKWSTHKTKLADPIKTLADSINSALVTALDYSVRQITASDSVAASDHMKTVEIASTVTTAVTVTLGDAATLTNNFIVRIRNSSAINQTIARATGGDTIDGVAASVTLPPGATVVYGTNTGANGFLTLARTGPFLDTNALVTGSSDGTKKLRFEVDGLTTGNTRVMTVPDYDGTLATLAGSEELTNKTLNASVGKGTWTVSGTWTLPAVTLGGAITYGGVTLSNSVTGTGSMVLSAGPTFTGTLAASAITASNGATISATSGAVGIKLIGRAADNASNLLFYKNDGTTLVGDITNTNTAINVEVGGGVVGSYTATGLSVTGTLSATANVSAYAVTAENTSTGASAQSLIVIAATTTATTSTTDIWHKATSGDNSFIKFYTEGASTLRGSISYNRGGGLVAYNTTSDYRLKDIYGGFAEASQLLSSLTVHDGMMKGATLRRPMFIAHELQQYLPWAVTGEKDAMDGETPIYQQVDHQSMVPLLVSGWQSHDSRIADLLAWKAKAETALASAGITIH